jgi:hypothetical protein
MGPWEKNKQKDGREDHQIKQRIPHSIQPK